MKGQKVPKECVLGIEAPMWTEWSAEDADIEHMLYPRLLAVAECGWTKERDRADFERRAQDYLEFAALNILQPMPWSAATVHGEEALKMIAESMVNMGKNYDKMSDGEDIEEAGKAEAVTPDGMPGGQEADMEAMIRSFMTDKMKDAYSTEELDKVVEMIAEMMREEA